LTLCFSFLTVTGVDANNEVTEPMVLISKVDIITSNVFRPIHKKKNDHLQTLYRKLEIEKNDLHLEPGYL
jgi:hypothetical protein